MCEGIEEEGVVELIGWIGGVCFAACAIPQVLETLRTRQCSVVWGTLLLWTIGEVCTLVYVLPTGKWPLIFNYLINLISLAIMLYYKFAARMRD